jgi:hypothetical protein
MKFGWDLRMYSAKRFRSSGGELTILHSAADLVKRPRQWVVAQFELSHYQTVGYFEIGLLKIT